MDFHQHKIQKLNTIKIKFHFLEAKINSSKKKTIFKRGLINWNNNWSKENNFKCNVIF